MNLLPAPVITPLALDWLATRDRLNPAQRALFSTIDGHRNVVQLESVARALGLRPDALETLRRDGLICFERHAAA